MLKGDPRTPATPADARFMGDMLVEAANWSVTRARPRVAILSTGNEVVEPGAPLARAQIYDVNRFTLAAVMIRAAGSSPNSLAMGQISRSTPRLPDQCHWKS